MTETSRQSREAEAHNQLAESYLQQSESEVFQPDTLIQALLDKTGNLEGKSVLECGCGRGLFTMYLVEQGAKVVAFDISSKMVELAKTRLSGKTDAEFYVGAIEELDLQHEYFDIVIGLDILHHVNLSESIPKIKKWLKPGGKALFLENSGLNPILALSRKLLAGHFGIAKYGTLDEKPLENSDIKLIKSHFKYVEIFIPQMIFFQIISRNILRYRHALWLQRLFKNLDEWLYMYFPGLRWLSYKAILILRSDL